MRWRRVVNRCSNPLSDRGNDLKVFRSCGVRCSQLKRRLRRADIMQPQDVTVAVVELRPVTIPVSGRDQLVCREVCVGDDARMIGIQFVQVRRGKRR